MHSESSEAQISRCSRRSRKGYRLFLAAMNRLRLSLALISTAPRGELPPVWLLPGAALPTRSQELLRRTWMGYLS